MKNPYIHILDDYNDKEDLNINHRTKAKQANSLISKGTDYSFNIIEEINKIKKLAWAKNTIAKENEMLKAKLFLNKMLFITSIKSNSNFRSIEK